MNLPSSSQTQIPGQNRQTVYVNDIAIEAGVGIEQWERVPGKTQKLLVDVEISAPLDRFSGTTIDDCLDYDRIYRFVTTTWTERVHTDLLETLAEELIQFCLEDRRIAFAKVRIRKPHVYNGRAVPAVEFERHRPTGATEHHSSAS